MSDSSDIEFSDDDSVLEKRRAELLQGPSAAATQEETDDAVFRSHFDRSHPNYHQGSTVNVPIGGQRVPESMQEHANWRDMPEQASEQVDPTAYGSVFEKLYFQRQALLDLKKVASASLPYVAALVQNYTEKTDNIRNSHVKDLEAVMNRVKDGEHGEHKEFLSDMQEIHGLINTSPMSAEIHQLALEKCKRFTQRIFGLQNALLQKMKEAKKEYLKNKAM